MLYSRDSYKILFSTISQLGCDPRFLPKFCLEIIQCSSEDRTVQPPKGRVGKSSQLHMCGIDTIPHPLITITPLRNKCLSVPFKILNTWMIRIITDLGSRGHALWGNIFMISPWSFPSQHIQTHTLGSFTGLHLGIKSICELQ